MKRTPTSVMVLSIIGIVIACVGFLSTALSLVGVLMPSSLTPGLNHDVGYVTVAIGFCVVYTLLYVLLISASIGSIRLTPRARKGMMV